MDYSEVDKVRRSSTPLQLDVVESFMGGRLSRREFITRGSIIGLSMASMTAIIAACSSSASPSPSAAGSAPASAAPTAAGSAPAASASAPAVTGGTIKVASQKPVSVDPVAMQDLGGYGITAQCFEFLCTLDPNGKDIAPGLALSWTPNADGTVWTFKLRTGVTWQKDGSPFTADDVVATMERLVAAGNSGLKGVLEKGGAVATDPNTVTFTLAGGNGNFPYLVSVFNAQTLITPKDYVAGTTLDKDPNGTGAWKLATYNAQTGATFTRNDAWWGGKTPLDGTEWIFFDATGPMVTAYQGQQVDAIVQFDVLSGQSLLTDPNFNLIATEAALHRQIWMRCDTGQFAKKEVRQALAYTFDRPALIQQLFQGKAQLGNDHVIWQGYPYFDPSVPQRAQDIDKAKSLLAAAGVSNLTATLHCGQLLEIPDLATLLKSQASQAGITLNVAVESLTTFYGAQWCPDKPADPPCSGAAELGIVDYGHRATPDVYLNAALKTKGIWNSSQYSSPAFDQAFKDFQTAVGVDAQKAACTKIETILNDDTPIGLPYFYNYLAGTSKSFNGVYSSALGQMVFSAASKVA
ncbi:MAG TPA: ABC transporter substrate-binding protein [Candidatus Limnocylindrales bacterium]|nr:ABC transporter substrate-binding protein [Candidatus Limnocylindrales bacterium]